MPVEVRKFSNFIGKTIKKTYRNKFPEGISPDVYCEEQESIIFVFDDNEILVLGHIQDCCEWVEVADISGYDLEELEGSTIIDFEKVTIEREDNEETATFYKIQTNKGFTTILFHGEGNGYYSLEVSEFHIRDGKLQKYITYMDHD